VRQKKARRTTEENAKMLEIFPAAAARHRKLVKTTVRRGGKPRASASYKIRTTQE